MEQPSSLSVRRATADDLQAVAYVWRESALAMEGKPEVPSAGALRERIDSELRAGWDLLVAVRAGRVVGLVALKPNEAWLDQLFVLRTEWRQGIGRALLEAAKQTMPTGFTLRMASANESARKFYEKMGLTFIGDGSHPWSGVPVAFYGWKTTPSSK